MNNTKQELPPVMILCGGKGTRIRDVSELLPKPMVPIGNQPILWHIMKTYASYNFKRFILCLGYKSETFIDYFLNYHVRSTDITINLGIKNKVVYHGNAGEEDWEITLAYTGKETMTGGRIFQAAKYLKDSDKNFLLTYGDAVANVNIAEMLAQHETSNKDLTVTAVHPPGRFGEMNIVGNEVVRFKEKPQTEEGFINGGFMAMKCEAINKYLTSNPSLIFEEKPMHMANATNNMHAYKHNGFWQCMDTAREHSLLNDLWESNKAPWIQNW